MSGPQKKFYFETDPLFEKGCRPSRDIPQINHQFSCVLSKRDINAFIAEKGIFGIILQNVFFLVELTFTAKGSILKETFFCIKIQKFPD